LGLFQRSCEWEKSGLQVKTDIGPGGAQGKGPGGLRAKKKALSRIKSHGEKRKTGTLGATGFCVGERGGAVPLNLTLEKVKWVAEIGKIGPNDFNPGGHGLCHKQKKEEMAREPNKLRTSQNRQRQRKQKDNYSQIEWVGLRV